MDLPELVYADRSDRAKLAFTGEQRAWFLHQILTQAFEDAQVGEALDTALITAHGRMVGFMETLVTEDSILGHFEPELRATLPDAIARYVIATRVEIEDVGDTRGLVLVAGPRWEEAVAGRPLVHRTNALGTPAAYLWLERDDVPAVIDALEGAGARRASEDELEAVRVANGVARWGRDMDEKTFPQEAHVDATAVHYDKGCYVGQEAMAKIHLRGKVNRQLRRLELEGVAAPGDQVTLDDAPAGTVTSVANGRALAMLRHTVEPGAIVQIGDSKATVLPASPAE